MLQAESRDLLAGIARVARWTSEEVPRAIWPRSISVRASWSTPTPGCGPAIPYASRASPRRSARTRACCARSASVIRGRSSSRAAAGRAGGGVREADRRRAAGRDRRGDGLDPYRLAGEVAKRITRDEDVLGTAKLFAGVAFLAVAWGLEATAAGFAWGAGWAAPRSSSASRPDTSRSASRSCGAKRRSVAARRAARVSPPDDAAARRAPPRARGRGRQRPARRRRGAHVEQRDASLDAEVVDDDARDGR